MENVLESNQGYTPERYAAAVRGEEYAGVKSGGIVELGEMYQPMNGQNRMNGKEHIGEAPIVPTQSIDVRVAELTRR